MICVDSSLAIKWILNEEHSELAAALYLTTLERNESIVAPALLLFEVTNIIRQRMRRQNALSLVEARGALADFLALPIEIHSPSGLHQQALALASAFDLPATYDAHYLALAGFMDCEFWTADQRLVRHVGRGLPFVRWLGDFAPNALA